MSSSELRAQPASLGPLGVASAQPLPDGCSGYMQSVDKTGKLWVDCLKDNTQSGQTTNPNDLWSYQP
jgi:hypothetical protein